MSSVETDGPDDDRLPWLETADDDYREGPSTLTVVGIVIGLLAVVAAAIFGYQYFRAGPGMDGNGAMIAAQEGDYKVKPNEPGGMKVEGEGDTAIATSNGTHNGNASINLKGVPEAPITGHKAAPATTEGAGASKAVVALPPSSGKLAAKTATPSIASGTSGGALVQIGSFPTEAAANEAWGKISKRLIYLASLGKSVQAAQVNGHTTYRLRVNAGSAGQASELCGKMKVAGEACFVAKD
ncbi:SPOR domain-containing protein [Sphingomonas immobilis]|uniref:SPOR domain-containing protein n=1 Tax=Sphingomonas immobilis TaxID=3063997 RepID=A0ABT8ZWR0_9SPHN|nr:SPOR domain-containing protein [Sphingomonas sp. CA1-15]MDO7842005.1 SPOR domain-containing protein [Sphingomonas sp. CA1-15]